MRFIIRTLAAGAVSIAAKIIIKKIREKSQSETEKTFSKTPNPSK
jgi:hypothetical protein